MTHNNPLPYIFSLFCHLQVANKLINAALKCSQIWWKYKETSKCKWMITTMCPSYHTCRSTTHHPLLTCRSLLPERKCPAVEAFQATCTLIWPPSTNVPAEWRAETAPSPRSPFSPCPMMVRAVAIEKQLSLTWTKITPSPLSAL